MLWRWIFVGLLLLTLASWAYTRFHVGRARRRLPPEGTVLEVDGVATHLVRRGQGRGAPILCLHGLNGFLQDFTQTPIVDTLAEDHEVVAIDRPGYGHSERPRPELSDPRVQADWLVELMDALGWDEPALVVGHSWGGGLAMTLAVEHPERVRGLVLLGPYVNPRTEPDDWIHNLPRLPFLRSFVGHIFLAPAMRLLGPRFISASFEPEPIPPGYHGMWVDISAQPRHFDTTLDEIRTVDPALAGVFVRYPALEVPLVAVTGASDQAVDPERNARWLVDQVPGAELVWLEGVGHMVPWLHSEQVIEAVERVEARAGQAARPEAAAGQAKDPEEPGQT